MSHPKYAYITHDVHSETKADEQGNYSAKITIGIHPTDGIAADFSKDIEVVSCNSQTGTEVDAQRQTAIDNFIASINQ